MITEAPRDRLNDAWCGGVATSEHVNAGDNILCEPYGCRIFRCWAQPSRGYCRDTGDLNENLPAGHGQRETFGLDYMRNETRVEGAHAPLRTVARCRLHRPEELPHLLSDGVPLPLRRPALRGYRPLKPEPVPTIVNVSVQTACLTWPPYQDATRVGSLSSNPTRPAVVYSFRAPGDDEVRPVHLEACPMIYARYLATSVLGLRAEAIAQWDDTVATFVATGPAHVLMVSETVATVHETCASQDSGSRRVAELHPTTLRKRFAVDDLTLTPFAAYTASDAVGQLEHAVLNTSESAEDDHEATCLVNVPTGVPFAATGRGQPE